MVTAASKTHEAMEAERDQRVVLRQLDWSAYESLLRIRGERPVPRMVYLDGSLSLVSPSFPHEHLRERFGWLVMVLVEELDLPCTASGSTTFRRQAKKGGVEPDQSYYLASEALVREKAGIVLDVDPPPDLVIEVAWTHKADAAVEVYRRLKVPEVWVWEGGRFQIFVLESDQYASVEESLCFPALAAEEIESWVLKTHGGSDTAWVKEFRGWVRQVLTLRLRQPGSDAPD